MIQPSRRRCTVVGALGSVGVSMWAGLGWAGEGIDPVHTVLPVSIGALLGVVVMVVLMRGGKWLDRNRSDLAPAWSAFADLRDGVIATDCRGTIAYINAAAAGSTGFDSSDAIGQPLQRVFRALEAQGGGEIDYLAEAMQDKGGAAAKREYVRLVRRDGTESRVCVTCTPMIGRHARVSGYVVVFRTAEIVERNPLSKAGHDPLTGLVDRHELEGRLALLLESARNSSQQHILLYIDLDKFKTINDACGHAAGDELLRSLTSLMSGKIRGSDTLARVGGDEFAALLPQCPLDQGLRIANAIREIVRDFRFLCQGRSFTVGASIGLVPLDAESGDVNAVLTTADACCADAKRKGRDRVQVFRVQADRQRSSDDAKMAARLSHAFEQGGFELYQQNIRPLKAAVSSPHFEVLVRLRGDDGELLPPTAFLPTAERYNLLTAIDRLVLVELLKVLAARLRTGAAPMAPDAGMYSLNLSGASINDSSFADFLRTQLAHYPVDPGLLCFEITETTAISNLTKAAELMHELKAVGCRFALDDFGIGMSSFAYLKYLPVDFLKIDGTFVKDMATDEMDYAIVEAINRIAHILGMQTVAEIVEDEVTLERLGRLGVDYAQGYHIARPEPLRSEVTLLATRLQL